MSNEQKGRQDAKEKVGTTMSSPTGSVLWPVAQLLALVAVCVMVTVYSLDIRKQVHNLQSLQVATANAAEGANRERDRYLSLIQELEAVTPVQYLTYTVTWGENLTMIAGRFTEHGVTVKDLMKDNNLKTDYLTVGQKLVVRLR